MITTLWKLINLQGEHLGRVNVSKIKPYDEPLEAKTNDLEVSDTKNISLNDLNSGETSHQDTHYHDENSIYSHKKEKQCKFYEGQTIVIKHMLYKQIRAAFAAQKWVGPYTITKIHDANTLELKPYIVKI